MHDFPQRTPTGAALPANGAAAAVDAAALAGRIHDSVLQLLGSALLRAELSEQLGALGRYDELPGALAEMRQSVEDAALELRAIMAALQK